MVGLHWIPLVRAYLESIPHFATSMNNVFHETLPILPHLVGMVLQQFVHAHPIYLIRVEVASLKESNKYSTITVVA